MSKNIINTFNLSIYNELIKRYTFDLRQLEKTWNIYQKMIGYYEKNELDYIEDIYIKDLIDIINSNLFSIFVPARPKKEINNILSSINTLHKTKNYERCIFQFKKIFNIIHVKLPEEF